VQFAFGKPQPVIAVELARALEAMPGEVENHDLAARFQDAGGAGNRPGRVLRVVQGLAEDRQIHAGRRHGRVLEVSEAKFEVLHVVSPGFGRAEGDNLPGVVNRDDFAAAPGQQLAQQALARPQVRHHQRRQDAQQQVPESLPGTPRAIDPVEPPRHLVEINLRLRAPAGQDALQIDLVVRVPRQFPGAADRQLAELAGHGAGGRAQPVKGALAFPPGLHKAGILQQPQVGGNARLAHPGDFLQFVDGELVPLQQRDDPQAGGVGQGPEAFQGGGHGRARNRLTGIPECIMLS